MKGMSLGLKEALSLMLECIKPLPAENIALIDSIDRVAASDIFALVDSPSLDASRKDGYAVLSHEVANATVENPVRLKLLGAMAAGDGKDIHVEPGTTVRVLTGACIPAGADAVVADEYVNHGINDVLIEASAKSKNVLKRGGDAALGQCILKTGWQISPVIAGLLAVAGHSDVPVFRNPVVGIIGTGDELIEPGKPLTEGKLYASNIITLAGWCNKYKMKTSITIVKDNHDTLSKVLKMLSDKTDVILTSGGAWTGDRDLVAQVLGDLGWKEIFHRIRIGPGKAVGFGLLDKKPVFILPGAPPANLVGFLQIALPGLLALSGHVNRDLPIINARLAAEIRGRDPDWTDFFFGILKFDDGLATFYPLDKRSRLGSIAGATALASIPEGQACLCEGSIIHVQLLK